MDDVKSPVLMQFPGVLRFSADGRWYHDDVEITHRGIRDYLSRHLRYDGGLQEHLVVVDGRAVTVQVEDTVEVVLSLEYSGSHAQSPIARLSSGRSVALGGCALTVKDETRWYLCPQAELPVRISWPAVQSLLPGLQQVSAGYSVVVSPQLTLPLSASQVSQPSITGTGSALHTPRRNRGDC